MNNSSNRYLAFSAFLIALSIAFGAFGAHILNPGLSEKYVNTLGTANQYFMINAVGMLVISTLNMQSRSLRLVFLTVFLGILLFSGSLYIIVLCKYFNVDVPFIIGPLTPIGGLLLMIGWICLAIHYIKN
jgi:uncharacterized membrane protein YgdD (TMEM256/DUF423 family)